MFPDNKTRFVIIFSRKFDTSDYFWGSLILIYQKRKLQIKNYEISKQTEITKNHLHLLTINMFFIQTLIINNFFKKNYIIILWNVLQVSTRAYFKGRAYIKITIKNHARSHFAGRLIIGETRYMVKQEIKPRSSA